MSQEIKSFRGEYGFLSNFYESPIAYDGITYRSSEAMFQAYKTLDLESRKAFSRVDASAAKKMGRRLVLRSDWEDVKVSVMLQAVLLKFLQNKELEKKLLDTGDAYLEEGNTWRDQFWGVCNGIGKNMLGRILMEVRGILRNNQNCFYQFNGARLRVMRALPMFTETYLLDKVINDDEVIQINYRAGELDLIAGTTVLRLDFCKLIPGFSGDDAPVHTKLLF